LEVYLSFSSGKVRENKKKMGSSGIPREIYIFAIILFYGLFGALYIAMVNTTYDINTDCTNPEIKCYNVIENTTYHNPLAPSEAREISIITKIVDAPVWINIFMGALTILLIFSVVTIILHG
jgi:hypothetical protein